MTSLAHLFENNRRWARSMTEARPDFFTRLASQQSPRYLWIGCADSRVPANEIVGLLPGELFVHRNVANLVIHTDLNCLSVLQFAVDVLGVEHVIVCGHFGCGGVAAALRSEPLGLIENWLRHIQDIRDRHAAILAGLPNEPARVDCLCALNVLEQAHNVCRTTILEEAWRRGRRVAVHAWIYRLTDGLLRDLGFTVAAPAERGPAFEQAVARVARREWPPAGD
ncbi:MAG TPA: carbonate dehydratase [Gemmatimonadales bacterium]|jgi:carbonic anhydrase|nr:carbonate dehydratase [Gemmatimonadales bacterium]